MICPCGKESYSSSGSVYRTCTYNDKGEIVYAVCMHGIVCIYNSRIPNMIEVLEDLKISVQNEVVGFEPCGREKDRIEALDKAIEVLKEKIK